MRMDNKLRAEVLIEALPYIRNYSGKILLVKYGGSAMVDENLKHRAGESMAIEAVFFSNQFGILGRTPGADRLLALHRAGVDTNHFTQQPGCGDTGGTV